MDKNEAQKKEDMLLDLYKIYAYNPNDAQGNILTPFGNFCEGWNACKTHNQHHIQELEAVNNQQANEIVALKAHIEELRNGLKDIETGNTAVSPEYIAKALLASTPQQSLQNVIDETIEKCVNEVSQLRDGVCIAEIIRAKKGKPL